MVGGAFADWAQAVALTTDGGFIVTGPTWSFGAGSYDVYLIKLNAGGDTLWTRTYGDAESNEGYSVQQALDGGYIIGGGTGLPTITDPTGALLIKTDSNGIEEWTRIYGGTDAEGGEYVIQTADGGYALCGLTNSFSATPAAYFVKTDSTGNVAAGVEQFGSSTALRVTVWLNPFSESATVVMNAELKMQHAEIVIYDIAGKTVRRIAVQGNRTVINRSGLPAGMYFLRVEGEGRILGISKIVIQ